MSITAAAFLLAISRPAAHAFVHSPAPTTLMGKAGIRSSILPHHGSYNPRHSATRVFSSSATTEASELSEEQKSVLESKIKETGDKIRALKEEGADKAAIAPVVEELLALKAELDPTFQKKTKKEAAATKEAKAKTAAKEEKWRERRRLGFYYGPVRRLFEMVQRPHPRHGTGGDLPGPWMHGHQALGHVPVGQGSNGPGRSYPESRRRKRLLPALDSKVLFVERSRARRRICQGVCRRDTPPTESLRRWK